ncbi:MAG: hypothetical protein ACOYMN_03080, partial [Roseimicrobium sp.]
MEPLGAQNAAQAPRGHKCCLTTSPFRAWHRAMFRRITAAAVALVSLLSLSSCLDYEEELTIHTDLSGEA